jgi:hypothetical protein
VILTARDLLRKIAQDSGLDYPEVAKRVNRDMSKGKGFVQSVGTIVEQIGLKPEQYRLNPVPIVDEALRILRQDYTQTLMMSAVLARMVESEAKDALPPPAFFAFLELLSAIPDAPQHIASERSVPVDEDTTRVIELLTTLVSLVCEWSKDGIKGVATDCPASLAPMARSVFRKTKLYQGGLWTCISCGRIVGIKETHALVCDECDVKMSRVLPEVDRLTSEEPERKAYGRVDHDKPFDR